MKIRGNQITGIVTNMRKAKQGHQLIAGDIILSAFEPNNAPIGADGEMSSARLEELEKECNLASTKLDYSQKEAVVFALNSNAPIGLIHGPPGTGECIFDALI